VSEERYKTIKENVYTRCTIAEHSGIGLSFPDKEEIELIDYVEELKDQLQQKENIIKEVREYIENTTYADITGLETHSIKEFWFVKELLEILDKEKE